METACWRTGSNCFTQRRMYRQRILTLSTLFLQGSSDMSLETITSSARG
jgi:hypothetical protein